MSSSVLKSSLKPSIKKPQTPGINIGDKPRKKRLSVKFSQNTEVRVIKASPRRHRNSPGDTVLSSAAYAALKNGSGSNKGKPGFEGTSDSSTDDVINDYVCQFSDGENTEKRVQLLNSGEDASLINDIINDNDFGDATNMFGIDSAPTLGQVADFYQPTQKIGRDTLQNVFLSNSGVDSSSMDMSFSVDYGAGAGNATNALGLNAPTLTDVAGFYEPTKKLRKKELENAFQSTETEKTSKKESKKKKKKHNKKNSDKLNGFDSFDNAPTDSSTDASVSLSVPPSLSDVAGFYEPTQKGNKKEIKKMFSEKERKRSAASEPSSSDTSTDISGGESNRRQSIVLDVPPTLADVADFYEPTHRPSKKDLKKAFSSKSSRRKSRKKTLSMEENDIGNGYLPSSSDSSISVDSSASFSEENSNANADSDNNGEFTNLISTVVPHLSELQNNENAGGAGGAGGKRRGTVIFNGADESMEFTQVGIMHANDNSNIGYDGTDDESMNLTNCYSKTGIPGINGSNTDNDDDMSLTNCLANARMPSLSFCDTSNDSVDMDITNTEQNIIGDPSKAINADKGSPDFMISKNNMTVSFSNIKPPQPNDLSDRSVNSSNDDGCDDSLNCEPTFLNASQFIESLSKATKSFEGQSLNASSFMELDTSTKVDDVVNNQNVEAHDGNTHTKKVNFIDNEGDNGKKKKKYSATPAASHGKLERVPSNLKETDEEVSNSRKVSFIDNDESNDRKKKKKYDATPAASHGKLERVPSKLKEAEEEDSHSKKVSFIDEDESGDKKKKKKYDATPAASHGKLERVPSKLKEANEEDLHSKKVSFIDNDESGDRKKKKKYDATPAASHGKLERVPSKLKEADEEDSHSKKVSFIDEDESGDRKKKKKYDATPAASHGKLERVPSKLKEADEEDSHSKKVNFIDDDEANDSKKKKKYAVTPAASNGKLERVPSKLKEAGENLGEEKEDDSHTKKVNFIDNDEANDNKKKKKYSATPAASHGKLERVPSKLKDADKEDSNSKKVNFIDEDESGDRKKKKKYAVTPAASNGKLERVPSKFKEADENRDEEKEDDSHTKKVNFIDEDESGDRKKKKKYSTTPAASHGKLERIPSKLMEIEDSTENATEEDHQLVSTTLSTTQSVTKKRSRSSSSEVGTLSEDVDSNPQPSKRMKRHSSSSSSSVSIAPPPPVVHKATYSELVEHFHLRAPARPGVYPRSAVVAAGVPFPLNPPQTPGRAPPTELELNLRSAGRGQMNKVLAQFQRVLEGSELPERRQDYSINETRLNSSESPYLYTLGADGSNSEEYNTRKNELTKLWKLSSLQSETDLMGRVFPQLCKMASQSRLERVQLMRSTLAAMRTRLRTLKERRSASLAECERLKATLSELEGPGSTPEAAAQRRLSKAMESDAPLVLTCTAATQTEPVDPRSLLVPEENTMNTLLAACGCGNLGALWSSPKILPQKSVAITFAGAVALTVDLSRARAALSLTPAAARARSGIVGDSSCGAWPDWAPMCVSALNDAVLGKVGGNKNLLESAVGEVAWKLEDVYSVMKDIEEVASLVPLEVVSQPGEAPIVDVTIVDARFRVSVMLKAGLVDKNGVPCIMNHPAASYSWDFASPLNVWWYLNDKGNNNGGNGIYAGRRMDVSKDDLFKKWKNPIKIRLTTLVKALKEGFERVALSKKFNLN